jgi:hypothetical protein
MAQFQWVILTSAVEGRVKEFEEWYDTRHLSDVTAIPGVVSAVRYKVLKNDALGSDPPKWDSLAIYNIEADDPSVVIEAIMKVGGTTAMPVSEALGPVVVQLLVSRVTER